jgi:outer membrane protein assembly factor BamB
MNLSATTSLILAFFCLLSAVSGSEKEAFVPVGWLRDGTATYPDAKPTLEWDSRKNILWRLPVGGAYSSPIIAGSDVIVTSEPDLVICLDLASGKERWRTATPTTELPKEQQTLLLPSPGDGGNMAGTPACDGNRVYVAFALGFVAAFDVHSGKRLWTHAVEAPLPGDGRSASPICVDGLVIVHLAQVWALDAKTGKVKWKYADAQEGYGTPRTAKIGNEQVLFLPKGDVLRVSDGKHLGSLGAALQYSSPCLATNKVLYIDSDFYVFNLPESLTGTLEPSTYWNEAMGGEIFSTPLIWNGLAYVLTRTGTLIVLDIKNKTKTEKQLDLAESCYPSPVLAGGYIFVGNDKGKTIVLEPGKDIKIRATNELGDGSSGTPAFSGDKMLVRSGKELVCIGVK